MGVFTTMSTRELTVDLFTTLDGFAFGTESPAYFGYLGPDLERWIYHEMNQPQVVLMGRVTYEALASYAPSGPDADADPLTKASKIVFSRTLREPSWANTRLIDADLADAIAALKDEPGAPMRTMGSLSLVTSLLHCGAVDRVRLVVFPQILGATGREPIFAGAPDVNLELTTATTLDERLVLLEYRPDG